MPYKLEVELAKLQLKNIYDCLTRSMHADDDNLLKPLNFLAKSHY